MNFAHGETLTRLRAPLVTDPYSGQPTTRDWANTAGVEMDGFALDPGGSSEVSTVSRERITTTPTLYGPYEADVIAADRVVVRGVTWEVTGHRADWRSPYSGWEPGSVWPLSRIEG